jgi:tRNA threonylcarbamoyl adenosine modification protein YeaZ/ribosomal-protein-alanine acetyltransferase
VVILALETATRRGSVALCDGETCVARDGDETRTHGERLPGELLEWLSAHGRRLDDVDAFAVVTGPGSFTGLRVGVAAIQGLALASARRVVGVPTLEAIAAARLTASGSTPPIIVPCLDGQRGDIFFAAFDASGAARIEACRVRIDPRVGRPEEGAAALAALAAPARMTLVGSGARKYAEVFERALPGVRIADVPQPIAEAAARLATRRVGSAVSPHALRPIYLRRPDAELARERAGVTASTPAATPAAPAWQIGVAEPDDLAAVEALQRRAFTNPWGAAAIKWELENTDVARLYVMRDPHGAVVAYCACWNVFGELHINSLAVEESLRRRGLARRLLHFVILDARAAGARTATLEVRQSNHAARLLYEGLGFKVEGVRRDYYQDPREDALILWHRDLGKFPPPDVNA